MDSLLGHFSAYVHVIFQYTHVACHINVISCLQVKNVNMLYIVTTFHPFMSVHHAYKNDTMQVMQFKSNPVSNVVNTYF